MKITKNINPKIFREYDIRAVYGKDLNEDVAYTIGKAFGTYVKKIGESCVLLGHDNRHSHSVLYPALMQGILDTGINVLSLGLITTPMHNFAKIHFDVNCAIMVTASHNPKEYNGFKMSIEKNDSLFGEKLQVFRKFLEKYKFDDGVGYVYEEDVFPPYLNYLRKSIRLGDRKVKAVIDCGNGTGSIFIETILKMFNVEYDLLYCDSDSDFPNHNPDPAIRDNMKDSSKRVLELGYDVGLAVDGDCDRVGMVLEDGTYISADMIMLIIYRSLASKVKKGVFDVKCSKSLIDELEKLDIEPCMNRTGGVYARNYINKNNLEFGGEYSGHLFFKDRYLGFDDGIYALLRVIEILSNTDKKASNLLSDITKYYSTDEINLKTKITDDNKFDIVNKVIKYAKDKKYNYSDIDGIRVTFEDGWALVRASNTSPSLTLRFEATTEKRLNEIQEEFTNVLENRK